MKKILIIVWNFEEFFEDFFFNYSKEIKKPIYEKVSYWPRTFKICYFGVFFGVLPMG